MDDKLLPQLKFVCHFYVNRNWRRQYVGIFTSQYDGVTYYFVDNEFYCAGDKPYNNITLTITISILIHIQLVVPVSYTHLDVYKRQHFHSS